MKRIAKLVISLGVFLADKASNIFLRLVGRKPAPRAVVLYYHGVSDTERLSFERQMARLVLSAHPISCASPPPAESLVCAAVTFDDGFTSVVRNALPVLREKHIPATVFVVSGCLGDPPRWVKSAELKARGEVIVSPDQLRALAEEPLICIGSHTVSHPRLATVGPVEASNELTDSKAALEAIISRPIELFSFPHGSCNPGLLRLAQNAGYKRAFGIQPTLAFQQPSEFFTGRVAVDPNDWPLEFLLKLSGSYRWLAFCRGD